MTQTHGESYGEHFSSTEYLREYGGLIVDISNLIDTLQLSPIPKGESFSFSIENIDETPLLAPKAVVEKIGAVISADVTYVLDDDSPSLCIELFSRDKTYRISRSPSTNEDNDTVFDTVYVNSFALAFADEDTRLPKAHYNETSAEFEKYITSVPNLSTADVARILLAVSQPALTENSDLMRDDERLAAIHFFDTSTTTTFIESLSAIAIVQTHFTDYEFIGDESAGLSYTQENGHASSFDFQCIDSSGKDLRIRGTLSHGATLTFPQHAVTTGLNNDSVVTTRSFPPTLSEIKHLRRVINQETDSLPEPVAVDQILLVETDYAGLDGDHIDRLQEEEERAHIREEAQLNAFNDTAELLIAQEFEDEYRRLLGDPKDPEQ